MKSAVTKNFFLSVKFVKTTRLFLAFVLILVAVLPGCKKPEEPKAVTPGLKLVADGFASPLHVEEAPDGSKRLFVLDQVGKIWIVGANGSKMPEPFLDITSKVIPLNPGYDERGLLGFAFHPNYKNNGRFFVYYNAPPRPGGPTPTTTWNTIDRLSEFRVSANPNVADAGSEKIILEENDPQSNHNGGAIAFGPNDGYLYIAIGDGGGANDNGVGHVPDWYEVNTGGNGQDIEANFFGDILRIDVNSGSPYGIPADNPFVGKRGRDEIYAFGFRNPYRFSFDMGGYHQLFAGDVGQLLFEEVNIVTKGGNYGWNVKEGNHCFNTDNSRVPRPTCPSFDPDGNPLIGPVLEFANVNNPAGGIATAVVGGNIYRGKALPNFVGSYIFGTYSQGGTPATPNGKVFIARPIKADQWSYVDLELKDYPNHLGQYLKGFGQDKEGEVYITTTGVSGPTGTTGKVYKIVNVEM
jgi:glucose/arabinose dehydrogenase